MAQRDSTPNKDDFGWKAADAKANAGRQAVSSDPEDDDSDIESDLEMADDDDLDTLDLDDDSPIDDDVADDFREPGTRSMRDRSVDQSRPIRE